MSIRKVGFLWKWNYWANYNILELQLPGKKRMSATALLNGLRQ